CVIVSMHRSLTVIGRKIEDRGSRIEDRGSRMIGVRRLRIKDPLTGDEAILDPRSSIFYLRSSILDPRRSYNALLQVLVFDTTILESTVLRIVTGDRVTVSVPLCDQGVSFDAFVDKEAAHRIGALLREPLVGGRITDVVGVAADFEHCPRRRGFDRRG